MTSEPGGRIEGDGYYALWLRHDYTWGHGIDVNVFDIEGLRIAYVMFACHPEFPEYELHQQMSTEQLVAKVRERLRAHVQDWARMSVHGLGVRCIPINSDDGREPCDGS